MSWLKQVSLQNRLFRNLILSLLSAILFSLAWLGGGSVTLFFAFVPLFIISESYGKWRFLLFTSLTIVLWTIFTTYWVANATILGVIGASITSCIIFNIAFLLYSITIRKAPKSLAYTIFVSAWIALEYLYLHNEQVSHPWLIIGNGFADTIKIVQWYEFSGALGGSLWVLVINLMIYEAIKRKSRAMAIATAILWIIPASVSLFLYYSYKEESRPLKVSLVQPNIDPYNEKFGGMDAARQLQIIDSLICCSPSDVNYIAAPETSIEDNINIDYPMASRVVTSLYNTMRTKYPNSELIIGATMFKTYNSAKEAPTPTSRAFVGGSGYYDVINGALQIGTNSKIDGYIKSKLVIGVEMTPSFITHVVDLGGMSGRLLKGDGTINFASRNGIVMPAICYESIYGEFVSQFARNGAQALFIITNDGWWKDTPGYKQHFSFARLRAVETRRSIARSANTGISGFINQRGDVMETLGWDVRATLTGEINLNDKQTFYMVFGDAIGRIASYILVLSLLYFVAYINKKRNHLN